MMRYSVVPGLDFFKALWKMREVNLKKKKKKNQQAIHQGTQTSSGTQAQCDAQPGLEAEQSCSYL